MFNLNNIDLSKEYRTTNDELKSAKSYIYQLVQELDFRLGLINQQIGDGAGASGLPSGGEDEQPLVGVTNKNAKWSNINYLSELEYLALAMELASEYSVTADYFVGEFCIYNSYVWECNTPITGGEAWNASHWTQLGGAS